MSTGTYLLKGLPSTRRVAVGLIVCAVMAIAAGLVAVPAHAEVVGVRKSCAGDSVQRCTHLFYRTDDMKVSAYAYIEDSGADDIDYEVATSNARLQRWNGSRWVTKVEIDDYDGWHPMGDGPATSYRTCDRYVKYRAVAKFAWKRGSVRKSDVIATRAWNYCKR